MNDKSNTTTRALKILDALKGRSLSGLTNKELSAAIGDTPVNVSRATAILEASGFVQRLETGRYALSYKLLQIAVAHAGEMQKASDRINEIQTRIYAGAF